MPSRGNFLTQKSLAARLGVSQALVSRALSGRAREIGASPQTIERIRRTARASGYEPSASALALLGAPTRVVGVAVKDFRDPYFGELVGALQGVARELGHTLLLTGSAASDFAALSRHRVDGVLLVGSNFRPALPAALRRPAPRLVQIGSGTGLPSVRRVSIDEEAAISAICDLIVGSGHRRAAFVGDGSGNHRSRGRAFLKAARERNLTVCPRAGALSRLSDLSFLKSPPRAGRATAIVAADDVCAHRLLLRLYAAGLSVPRDVSVVGFDDISASTHCIPPLTTIRQPVEDLAAWAFRLLADETLPSQALPGGIVVRASLKTLSAIS
jgi:LacI family transcriptional regulator